MAKSVRLSKPPFSEVSAHNNQGDRIIVVVQKARGLGETLGGAGGAAAQNKVKRGDIRHAVIVRTKKKVQRKDGMVVRFDDNACALIGKNGEPLGTRINGKPPVSTSRCGLRQLWDHSLLDPTGHGAIKY